MGHHPPRTEADAHSEATSRFEYTFWGRHVFAPYIAIQVIFASSVAYAMHPIREGGLRGYLIWWGGWLFLIVGNVALDWANQRVLRPVLLAEWGIGVDKGDEATTWFPWSSVDRIQEFAWPDLDGTRMAGKGGMRISIGDERILIYQHIRGYAELRRRIGEKAEAVGVPVSLRSF